MVLIKPLITIVGMFDKASCDFGTERMFSLQVPEEPLIRKFGETWYNEMESVEKNCVKAII